MIGHTEDGIPLLDLAQLLRDAPSELEFRRIRRAYRAARARCHALRNELCCVEMQREVRRRDARGDHDIAEADGVLYAFYRKLDTAHRNYDPIEREWEIAELRALVRDSVKALRSAQARAVAEQRQANDPKQAAKVEALKLWKDWQAGCTRYKSGAALARHVVETLPIIESTKAVERWVTQWRKDAKATKQASR